MDKIEKYECIVKYLKDEISYNELGNLLLGEENLDFFENDNFVRYSQEKINCLKNPEFYQYLVDNGFLIEMMKDFKYELNDFLDERKIIGHNENIEQGYINRKQILEAIILLPDKDKLDILNYTEEEEYEEVVYNPITSEMDNEILKSIILSLSEEEKIKFLIDPHNKNLHFERLDDNDKIEIFTSLSEENKLRIFSEYTTIKYEEWTTRFIPFLENSRLYGKLVKKYMNENSKMEILKNSENKYEYILQILEHMDHFGRLERNNLIDIILNLDVNTKMEILKNTQNEYDTVLGILKEREIEEFVFDIEKIDDETIEILNKYLLHESDNEIRILGEKLKELGDIDSKVLKTYRYELISYLQNESDEKIQFLKNNLKKLKSINEDILSTCQFKLLTEEYRDLDSKLDIITCDSKVQEKILKLNENQYKFLLKVLDVTEKDNIKDWIPVLDNILNGLNNIEHKNLLESLDGIELTNVDTIKKLAYIFSMTENIFNIQNVEEIEKFDRLEYVEKIKQKEFRTKHVKNLTNIELLRLCVLEKRYGQSLEQSKRLLKTYGKDLDEFEVDNAKDAKVKSYLESIRDILTIDDEEYLEELYNNKENIEDNYLFSSIIESEIRSYFTRQYNKLLYEINDDKKIVIDLPLSAQGVQLYDAGEKFMIELTSLGAYSKYDYTANFNDEWNRRLIKSHGFCTTPIANNNIATARIKYAALGFNNFSENSLLLSAPWDINSTLANEAMNTSQYMEEGILYDIPHKQIDNTRHTHPENVRERRALEDGKIYKKQPNYIVYIPQIPLEKYLELQQQGKMDDRDERNKLLLEYMQEDKIWENSVRAAKDFSTETEEGEVKPLPIVVVDRTYIAIKEREKIDKLEKQLRETGNPSLINKIIVDSENNRTGNTFYDEIRENLFSPQILQDRISRIEAIIQELEIKNKKLANKCKRMLISTTLEEKRKYECFGYDNKLLRTKRGYNHDEYLKKWLEEYKKSNEHSIDEDELAENSNRVSEKERREATEVLHQIIQDKNR